MFSPFLSLGTKLLHLFVRPPAMFSDTELPSSIPNSKDESFHVDRWWKIVEDGTRSREEVENLTVEKVRWFKESTGVTHEYLVFTVNVEKPKRTVSLNIERSTNDEVIDDCLASDDPLHTYLGDEIESIPQSERKSYTIKLNEAFDEERQNVLARERRFMTRGAFLSSSRSLAKRDPSVALDTTRRCELVPDTEPTPDELNAECLLTLTFDKRSTKFFLRDLSLMARAVRESHPTYSWAKHNCFWFARTLADVIISMKDPIITPPGKVKRAAGNAYLGRISRCIIKANPQEVAQLIPKIQDYIHGHEKKISDEWEQGKGWVIKGKKTIEEQRREIEEHRRTIQEQDRIIAEYRASQKAPASDPTNYNFDAGRTATNEY